MPVVAVAPGAVALGAVAAVAVAVVAALVDVAVRRPLEHLAPWAIVVVPAPLAKVVPAAVSEAEGVPGLARQAQVAELWSPSAAQRGAAPVLWQPRQEQGPVHALPDRMAPPESQSSSARSGR